MSRQFEPDPITIDDVLEVHHLLRHGVRSLADMGLVVLVGSCSDHGRVRVYVWNEHPTTLACPLSHGDGITHWVPVSEA